MAVAGVVQCIPIAGLLGANALQKLYDIEVRDDATLLLLRHRAVLLALVGVVIGAGIFRPSIRGLAIGVGLTSKISFLLLHHGQLPAQGALARVAKVDAITFLLLLLAGVLSR
jgi:hypothetical protein